MIRALYGVLTALIAPLAFAAVLARGLLDRSYWTRPLERFGWGRSLDQSSIWLHAVSVGEVAAAAPLVRALRERHPGVPLMLTTATPTGRARARALFGADADIRFLPYDTRGAVRRFLARIRPRLAIIMETEVWPNLLYECHRRGVPVAFASARLRPRSVSRYRRFGGLFAAAVARSALVAAQTSEDAERFVAIGADRARTHVVGNLKFDLEIEPSLLEQGRALRAALGPRPVWVAGSTHAGEEEELLRAHAALGRAIPETLLVLVPRHPQRFEGVAQLLARQAVRFERLSAARPVPLQSQVLLGDSMGELNALYAAADVAFVGGSLVPVGGHNLIEPAALGKPILTGPYTANSRQIAQLLIERGGALEVPDADSLADALRRLFENGELRERMGTSARACIALHRGSVTRLLELLEPMLTG
jgi:3-deoxy-D-manno-octulosonic-acid transferase